MSARRWSKFWWQDWQRDPALRMCSPAARGIWMDMLAIMHDAEPCGHLLVNGRAPNTKQLSLIFGVSEKEGKKLIAELEENGVFSRSDCGVIFNRRMVRDKAVSDEAVVNGKKGGNPKIVGKEKTTDNPKKNKNDEKGLTPPVNHTPRGGVNHQEAEAEADISSLRSDTPCDPPSPSKPDPRGHRLPEDWQPSHEDRSFAMSLGINPTETGEKFRDYWIASPAAKGRKTDWSATWRNWCRNDAEKKRGAITPLTNIPQSRQERVHDAWAGVPTIPGV